MPRWSSARKDIQDNLDNPEDKFSLKHMLFLCTICEKYAGTVTYKTKNIVVETLRQLSELILWGDQHDPQFFDIFLEQTTLTYLIQVLKQDVVEVKIQLLQTLSILIQNLKSEMALFFLLSNNYINDLIGYKWDFKNEDVMANYVSFLKTISLKLNPRTIQFFFNHMKHTFPLYTEAIKFHDSKESMVRIAVKTLTLNVFKVEDDMMQRYVIEETIAPYFSDIISFFVKQMARANQIIEKEEYRCGELQEITEELMDIWYYIQDVLALNIEKMSNIITYHIIQYLVLPIFARNIKVDKTLSPPLVVQKKLCFYLLCQFFHIFSHGPTINAACAILVHPSPELYYSFYSLPSALLKYDCPPNWNKTLGIEEIPEPAEEKVAPSAINSLYSSMVVPVKKSTPQTSPAKKSKNTKDLLLFSVRDEVLQCLESDEDQLLLSILSLLYSILNNHSLERNLLSVAGLFPHRLAKVQNLFDSLVGGKERKNSDLFGDEHSNLFADLDDDNGSDSTLFNDKKTKKPLPSDHIVDNLIGVLFRSAKYRSITLELTSITLKGLVYSKQQETKLSAEQKDLIETAYQMSVANLKERLVNSEVGEIFLELFEEEMKNYAPLYFENLVTDFTTLLPIPCGPTRGINFEMRLPEGDEEETKKAVQNFLLSRTLKFDLLEKNSDTLLPLKESPCTVSREIGDIVPLEEENALVHSCGVTSLQRDGTISLAIDGPYLLFLQRSCNNPEGNTTCIVKERLHLQNIEIVVSQGDPNTLLSKAGSLEFQNEEEAQDAQNWITKGKETVRLQKLQQLYTLLGIDTEDAQKIVSRRRSKPLTGSMTKPSPLSTDLESNEREEANVGEEHVEESKGEEIETESNPDSSALAEVEDACELQSIVHDIDHAQL